MNFPQRTPKAQGFIDGETNLNFPLKNIPRTIPTDPKTIELLNLEPLNEFLRSFPRVPLAVPFWNDETQRNLLRCLISGQIIRGTDLVALRSELLDLLASRTPYFAVLAVWRWSLLYAPATSTKAMK